MRFGYTTAQTGSLREELSIVDEKELNVWKNSFATNWICPFIGCVASCENPVFSARVFSLAGNGIWDTMQHNTQSLPII